MTAATTTDLHARLHQLQRLVAEGRLDDLAPQPADEDLLGQLGPVHHRDTCVYIEAWLTTAYLDAAGCYTDPAARAASLLPALVLAHANRHHTCPPDCPGTRTGGKCDGCAQACEGGAHLRRALLSRLFARLLADRQRDARRLLLTPLPGPEEAPRAVGRHRRS
ncbi:hypothetical protein [Kitasatospora sp. NPDC004272]